MTNEKNQNIENTEIKEEVEKKGKKKVVYTNKQQIQRLTTASVLCALSVVLMMTLRFPLFTAFYEMEFSDLPLLICAGLLGPGYGVTILFGVCVIQALTVSAGSGIIGFLMHFLSSALMLVIYTFLKKNLKGIEGTIVSCISAIVAVVFVMVPMNMWLTSSFLNLPVSEFVSGYMSLCIAFNIVKAGTNVIIYSIISPAISKIFKNLFPGA